MSRPIRLLAPLLPAVTLLGLAPASSAMPPTMDTISRVTQSTAPCPDGVVLRGRFEVTRRITTFYDDAGTPIREEWVVRGDGTWTNPVTGASLPSHVTRVFQRDLVTGELSTTGANAVTRLPDGGVAIGGAGRLVFDATGQLVEHDGPDMAAERAQLCDALGA